MLIFVAIFAMAGSATLLSSYADRDTTVTSKVGTYELSDFREKDAGSYTFSLTAGLLYCFTGSNLQSGQTVSITPPDGLPTTVALVADQDAFCFSAASTIAAAEIQLSTQPSGNTLEVR